MCVAAMELRLHNNKRPKDREKPPLPPAVNNYRSQDEELT